MFYQNDRYFRIPKDAELFHVSSIVYVSILMSQNQSRNESGAFNDA
jgi:hypothetical protein